MSWTKRRRAAIESAALELLRDRRAPIADRDAAKRELATGAPDVRKLSDDELATARAIARKLIGETDPTGLVLRVVGERPIYRACDACAERRGQTWINVSWAASDPDLLGSITEALDEIRRTPRDTEANEPASVEGDATPQLGDVDREGAPTSTGRTTDATADGTGG